MQMMTRLQEARSLDVISDKLQAAVQTVAKPQQLRDLLHGTWLGHPLHPVLVQVPIGSFLSAAVLDLLPGRSRAATTLIAVGTAGVAPAVAAGLLDWSQMTRDRRRVGLVHASANVVAVGLYAASLIARLRGRATRGKTLGFAGLSVAGLGAYLGGHLAYAQSAGVNQAAPETVRIPEEWTSVGSLASMPDGRPAVRTVGMCRSCSTGRPIRCREWLLALSGILSVVFGVLLAAWPAAGVLTLVTLIGVAALVIGMTLLVFGLRMRHNRADGPAARHYGRPAAA